MSKQKWLLRLKLLSAAMVAYALARTFLFSSGSKLLSTGEGRKITFLCMRHGQAEHNIGSRDSNIRDPSLTKLGFRQAKEAGGKLRQFVLPNVDHSNDGSGGPVDLIICSPMRRTIQTLLTAFPPEFIRNSGGLLKLPEVILLPHLQELHDTPCDTGVALEELRSQFTAEQWSVFNTSLVPDEWYNKGPAADDDVRHQARAAQLQGKLIEIVNAHPTAKRVLVVGHSGNFRHWLFGGSRERKPRNCEVIRCELTIDATAATRRPVCSAKAVVVPDTITL